MVTLMDTDEAPAGERRVWLRRRVAVLRPDLIEIRPARGALVGPLVVLLLGLAACGLIALGLFGGAVPLWLMALLLVVAVLAIPMGGLGVVYGIVGTHVIFDRHKGTATWQQGLIGLGIGTNELTPFAKIAAIVVEEAGATPASGGQPVEEFAQWQVVVEKSSGRRLEVGGATGTRAESDAVRARAEEVATAIAALTGAPLRLPAPTAGHTPRQGETRATRADDGARSHPPSRRRTKRRRTPR